ncbi:MAG: hypothetical protein P8M81_07730 [Litorivicinaceae bacterium]|nr:hypothetical protein [Litorivicinaceae bacterium]
MNNESFDNFVNDSLISSLKNRDFFYRAEVDFHHSLSAVQLEAFYKVYVAAKNFIKKNCSMLIPKGEIHNIVPVYDKRFGWVLTKCGETAFLGKCNFVENPTVKIGRMSYFSSNWVLRGTGSLNIGNFSCIAEGADISVGTDDHPFSYPANIHWGRNERLKVVEQSFDMSDAENLKNTVIGNDVWLGRNVRVQSGSVIGDGVVVAEGSLVRGELMPYGIYAGRPAKLKKFRFSELDIKNLLEMKWWLWSWDDIKSSKDFFCSIMDKGVHKP